MKTIIMTIFMFITFTTMASTAKFLMEIELQDLNSEAKIFSYQCQVKQTLTWESQLNFFSCSDEKGEKVNVTNVITDVGYDYDLRQAFSLWGLSQDNGLVKKLLLQNNIQTKLKSSNPVKIFYGRQSPRVTSNEYLIEAQETTYSFFITLFGYND